MRQPTQGFTLRACQVLLAAMLCGVCHAAPVPAARLREMQAVLAQCIAQRMPPDQICLRLRRQFGYDVYGRGGVGDKGTDIVVQVGSGIHITFLATIGRVPYCGAAQACGR